MAATPTVFPPSSIEDVLVLMAALSDENARILISDIRQHGFEATQDRCDRLARAIGLTSDTVAVSLGVIAFLYTRVAGLDLAQREAALSQLVDDLHATTVDRTILLNRVREVSAPSPEIDVSRKVTRLRSGFLKNATSFASFVDIRPDFESGYESIRGLIPIVQFRVTTDAESISERQIVFQLDRIRLRALKEAVEAAERKLDLVTKPNSLTAPFHRLADS